MSQRTEDYATLRAVLDEAYSQSAEGKGNARHANERPFDKQPILEIGRMVGPGFAAGQVMKKAQEAIGMAARGEADAAARELLGAIVYAASAVVLVREKYPVLPQGKVKATVAPFQIEVGKSYVDVHGKKHGPMIPYAHIVDCYCVERETGLWNGDGTAYDPGSLDSPKLVAELFEMQVPREFKVEAGKFYRTRNGKKVGPMKAWVRDGDFIHEEADGVVWEADGTVHCTPSPGGRKPVYAASIVAEWVD